MIEAIGSCAISLIIFAWGYGRLSEKVSNQAINQRDTDKELEKINTIQTDVALIRKDIQYIKEKI